MISLNSTPAQFAFALSVVVLLLSGCSGSTSDNTNSPDSQSGLGAGATSSDVGMSVSDDGSDPAVTEQNATQNVPEPEMGIRSDNYLNVLRAAAEATNVTSLLGDAESIRTLAGELLGGHNRNTLHEQGLTLISEESFPGGINQHYSCDAGGNMVLPVYDPTGIVSKLGLIFEECFVGADQYDGVFSSNRQRSESDTMAFDQFSAELADGSSYSIDGLHEQSRTRGGIFYTDSWKETDYIKKETSGVEFKQLGLTWLSTVERDVDLVNEGGYVTLADGTVGLASPYNNNASVVANFDLDANLPETGLVKVSTDLLFDGDYFRWNKLNPEERENFVVPTYPVSDLGNPLVADRLKFYGGGSISLDSRPQIPEGSEQWDTGSLSVKAEDGSQVVMRPTVDSTETVDVQLNESSDVLMNSWSDGLQINCPFPITGC